MVRVIEEALDGVKLLEPLVFGDERGFFMENWNAKVFADIGIDGRFVQDNHSLSARCILRGLHYQIKHPQGKLVRVTAGRAFDVVVDLRRSSPTFGQSFSVELSSENKYMLWVPPGFSHGFLSLEDGTEFLYKCTDYYAPKYERSLLWNDPQLGIKWPLEQGETPTLSAKDAGGLPLAKSETYP